MTTVRNLALICNRKSLAGFENGCYKIWWVFGKGPSEYSTGNGLLFRETRLKVGGAIRSYWHHLSGEWCWLEPGWEYWKLLDLEYMYFFFHLKAVGWIREEVWGYEKTMTLERHCVCSRKVSNRPLLSFLSERDTLQIKAIVLSRPKKEKRKKKHPPQ